jgi:peroxin-10
LLAATQTLGEEYTDIWQHSVFTQRLPSLRLRAALILFPSLPSYLVARWGSVLSSRFPRLGSVIRYLPSTFEVIAEVNLAIFYLRGTYYDVVKRMLGIQHVRFRVDP